MGIELESVGGVPGEIEIVGNWDLNEDGVGWSEGHVPDEMGREG